MIPADTLQEKLASLTSENRQTLVYTHPETHSAVKVEINQIDTLACQLWDVEVVTGVPPKETITERAEQLTKRVSGLMEPLTALEIDTVRGIAQLRSNPPALKNQARHYYELMVEKSGRTTVRRYEGSYVSMERKRLAFTLTREALAKLVSDLSS